MTEIVAIAKHIRVSPKKIRLVAQTIKGLKLEKALEQLAFMGKAGSLDLAKTLKSAIANAENNLKVKKEDLKIKIIEVGSGPFLKRFRAVSRGTAHQYKKRTSHIRVVLEETEKK